MESELTVEAKERFGVPHPDYDSTYNPPTPPYEDGASGQGWLEFTGPGEEGEGARLWVHSFWLNDALADREVTTVLWVVDWGGRILFEHSSWALGVPGRPSVAQDITGNGVDEVVAGMHLLIWNGEEFGLTTDPRRKR